MQAEADTDEIRNPIDMTMTRQVATAIWEAGEIAKRMRDTIRANDRFVVTRGLGDHVTEADTIVAETLRKALLSITPGAGFLTEDGTCITGTCGARWVVDPIDGTGNYLSDLPFAISIAYEEEGKTWLGMVYELPVGRLFLAKPGEGAFLVESLSSTMPCYVEGMVGGGWLGKPISRGYEADMAIMGMPYDRRRTEDSLRLAGRLHSSFGDVKRIGPASLDMCRVATGGAMIYAEYDLAPWDYMAAELIATESGCLVERDGNLVVCGTPNGMRRYHQGEI